jgi:hypothetical protein
MSKSGSSMTVPACRRWCSCTAARATAPSSHRFARNSAQEAVGPPPGSDGAAEAERTRWFYTPTDHGGLTSHQQHPAQHRPPPVGPHRPAKAYSLG